MYKGPEHVEVFDRAMSHIKYAVELKRRKKLDCTLGIQMVLMPEFKDEIIPFAKLAIDLGVDYGVIKHCSDDEYGTLGVDYEKYESMYDLLDQAEQFSNEQTKVIVKWEKIKDKGKPSYKRFYGPQFLLQISGSKNKRDCCMCVCVFCKKLNKQRTCHYVHLSICVSGGTTSSNGI